MVYNDSARNETVLNFYLPEKATNNASLAQNNYTPTKS